MNPIQQVQQVFEAARPAYKRVTPEMWDAIERDQKIDALVKKLLRGDDIKYELGEVTADDGETICRLVAEGKDAEAGAHFVRLLKGYVTRWAERVLIERGEIQP